MITSCDQCNICLFFAFYIVYTVLRLVSRSVERNMYYVLFFYVSRSTWYFLCITSLPYMVELFFMWMNTIKERMTWLIFPEVRGLAFLFTKPLTSTQGERFGESDKSERFSNRVSMSMSMLFFQICQKLGPFSELLLRAYSEY